MLLRLAQMRNALSLAPGFSPVSLAGAARNRFTGFPRPAKPLKRLVCRAGFTTPLKRGANEMHRTVVHLCGCQ